MKFRDLGTQERIEYADIYNKACLTEGGELRSTEDAAVELQTLLADAVQAHKTWAQYEQDDVRDRGYREAIKSWTARNYRHLTANGRSQQGRARVRSRSSIARVPQRRAEITEQLVIQWVNKTYEDCSAADLRLVVQRSNAQIEAEQQTVRDCYRLLGLLDQTGTTTVRNALLLIGRTLSEFLTGERAAS